MPLAAEEVTVGLEGAPLLNGRRLFGATCTAQVRSTGDIRVVYGIRPNQRLKSVLETVIPGTKRYGRYLRWRPDTRQLVVIITPTDADGDLEAAVQLFTTRLIDRARSELSQRTPQQVATVPRAVQASTTSRRSSSPRYRNRQLARR